MEGSKMQQGSNSMHTCIVKGNATFASMLASYMVLQTKHDSYRDSCHANSP